MHNKYWTQADGRRIPIVEMDDSHLLASIAMIDRMAARAYNTFLARDAAAFALIELGPDVDLVDEDLIVGGINDLVSGLGADAFKPDIYFDMQEEAKRRGLEWVRHGILYTSPITQRVTIDFRGAPKDDDGY